MKLKGDRIICKDFYVSFEPLVGGTSVPQDHNDVLCSYVVSGKFKYKDIFFSAGDSLNITKDMSSELRYINVIEDGCLCCFFSLKNKTPPEMDICAISEQTIVDPNTQVFVIEGAFQFEDKTLNKYNLMVERKHSIVLKGKGVIAKAKYKESFNEVTN